MALKPRFRLLFPGFSKHLLLVATYAKKSQFISYFIGTPVKNFCTQKDFACILHHVIQWKDLDHQLNELFSRPTFSIDFFFPVFQSTYYLLLLMQCVTTELAWMGLHLVSIYWSVCIYEYWFYYLIASVCHWKKIILFDFYGLSLKQFIGTRNSCF